MRVCACVSQTFVRRIRRTSSAQRHSLVEAVRAPLVPSYFRLSLNTRWRRCSKLPAESTSIGVQFPIERFLYLIPPLSLRCPAAAAVAVFVCLSGLPCARWPGLNSVQASEPAVDRPTHRSTHRPTGQSKSTDSKLQSTLAKCTRTGINIDDTRLVFNDLSAAVVHLAHPAAARGPAAIAVAAAATATVAAAEEPAIGCCCRSVRQSQSMNRKESSSLAAESVEFFQTMH